MKASIWQLMKVVLLGVLFTVASGLYGAEFNWPDYHHIDYGFPLPWLIRTLSTIAGPADFVEFIVAQFVGDLAFWSVFSGLVMGVIIRIRRSS